MHTNKRIKSVCALVPIAAVMLLLFAICVSASSNEASASVTEGQTTHYYGDFISALSKASNLVQDSDSEITLKLLKPVIWQTPNYTFEHNGKLTIDLGGFEHDMRSLKMVGSGSLTVKNGTLNLYADSNSYYYNEEYGIFINHKSAELVIESDATIASHRDEAIKIYGGTLRNYGTVTTPNGHTCVRVVDFEESSLYNYGTLKVGGCHDSGAYAVWGMVRLNAGTIRGGDGYTYGGDGIYGSLIKNTGEIIGGDVIGDNSSRKYAGAGVNLVRDDCMLDAVKYGYTEYEGLYALLLENTGTIRGGKVLNSDDPHKSFHGAGVTCHTRVDQSQGNEFIVLINSGSIIGHEGSKEHVEAGISDEWNNKITQYVYKNTGVISPKPADFPFTDVYSSDPFYDDIKYVYQKGLMLGTDEHRFSPKDPVTRAMIVTLLWRKEGSPVVNYLMQFDDVSEGEWYSEAVRWASAEGIVTGVDESSFAPNTPVTREQLTVILYRYLQYHSGGFKGMWMFRLGYDDGAEVSDWAYEAVCYMTMHNVYVTDANNLLDPKTTVNRAEAAAFLHRYCEMK